MDEGVKTRNRLQTVLVGGGLRQARNGDDVREIRSLT